MARFPLLLCLALAAAPAAAARFMTLDDAREHVLTSLKDFENLNCVVWARSESARQGASDPELMAGFDEAYKELRYAGYVVERDMELVKGGYKQGDLAALTAEYRRLQALRSAAGEAVTEIEMDRINASLSETAAKRYQRKYWYCESMIRHYSEYKKP